MLCFEMNTDNQLVQAHGVVTCSSVVGACGAEWGWAPVLLGEVISACEKGGAWVEPLHLLAGLSLGGLPTSRSMESDQCAGESKRVRDGTRTMVAGQLGG
mmetsp:Transcript_76823/g.178185  ORF Transcript_76823/g.178185 Transcript_76823/m.178185 type:complete len:100 (-) Transcript_76823:210-509(-)